jgi:ubiquinone/menaquinone biosynthesis C-methylase UbiE
MRLFAAVALTCLAACSGCSPTRLPSPKNDAPSSRYVAPLFEPSLTKAYLEGPERDRWQQPARIVKTLRLRPGSVVADIGSGSGYLLPYLSRAVGPAGRIYAEEIQRPFLSPLRVRSKKLRNIRVVHGTAEDPRLPARDVDCFMLLTVYHEVQKPAAFLSKLRSYAKPGARLAIIDFDDNRHGQPPAPVNHWVSEKDVLEEAKEAGWELAERHEFLSSQFFLVFRQARLNE